MTRVAFIHTGAVVIPTFAELANNHLPGVEVQHLLDDKIVADLGLGAESSRIADRLAALGRAAAAAGSSAVIFSCSSISGYAEELERQLGLPVLRIDEAMADRAVGAGARIAVIATLPTTVRPTAALLRERAERAGRTVELTELVVDGAFAAVSSGDRTTHDRLVGAAITAAAESHDVIVLAQASMAGAAGAVSVGVEVLTSPELGMRRAAEVLGLAGAPMIGGEAPS
ncbi:aspartate/glutamate racemase family protein [Microlunatus speluncae]|uniref:aspartate/glutamate racemase family protein n=1 Tax=Microlunatus speluncae TaxID=2594267 RepID=UPI00126643CF|nr:aspartate/glutamate racemase family protein [Microlunatus speluncae]